MKRHTEHDTDLGWDRAEVRDIGVEYLYLWLYLFLYLCSGEGVWDV